MGATTCRVETFLGHAGYGALLVLAFVEACCIPIPSELTVTFAGVLAGSGRLDLGLVIVLATLGELAGSFVSYGVGRLGGRPLVDRLGRYVLLTRADLDRAERWFERRGEVSVVLGRAMPVLRAFVSVVAGVGEMPVARFGLFSLLGTAAYVAALSSLGFAFSRSWQRIVHGFALAGYAVAAVVVVTVAGFVAHRLRVLRAERRLAATPGPGPG